MKIRRTSTAEKKQEDTPSAGAADAPSGASEVPEVPSKAAASPNLGKDMDHASRPALSARSEVAKSPSPPTPVKPALTGLGLAAYSSDEDE